MTMRIVLIAAVMAAPALALAQPKGDVGHGEAVFEDRCSSCHVREGGGQGPSLVGVVGRPAATASGVNFSKALQGSHLTWTAANLDRFLTNPTAMVPGTAMPLAVPNAKDRSDLIAFLASPANKR